MEANRKYKNRFPLLITQRSCLKRDVTVNSFFPFVALLTVWDSEPEAHWKCSIEYLLKSGCKCFICYGEFSESLHDLVDDIIEDGSYSLDVITTYHDDEAPEEIIDFIVSSISLNDIKDSGLLAMLDGHNEKDEVIKEMLCKVINRVRLE